MSVCRYCGRASMSKDDMRRSILKKIGYKSAPEMAYGVFSTDEMSALHSYIMSRKEKGDGGKKKG